MKELSKVLINGNEYPVFFCARVFTRWMRKVKINPQAKDFNKLLSETLGDMDSLYELIYLAIKHGCGVQGKEFDLTLEQLGYQLDLDEESLSRIMDIYAKSQETGEEFAESSETIETSGDEKKEKAH